MRDAFEKKSKKQVLNLRLLLYGKQVRQHTISSLPERLGTRDGANINNERRKLENWDASCSASRLLEPNNDPIRLHKG